jgi:hypothetical protein
LLRNLRKALDRFTFSAHDRPVSQPSKGVNVFTTIGQIKAANERAGQHFFEPGAMRFFGTRISPTVYAGRYFVTSETPGHGAPRRYTVRSAESNGHVETIGEFCGLSRYRAHKEAERLGFIETARLRGVEDAESAATWATDGNMSIERARDILARLQLCDSYSEDLPARPNLSGEWADDLTPQRLFEQIIGEPERTADYELMDQLADAYEEGVGETFEPACEVQLLRFLEPERAAA